MSLKFRSSIRSGAGANFAAALLICWAGSCAPQAKPESPQRASSSAQAPSAPDVYRGVGVRVTTAVGSWHTVKLGNRWVLATPEGHAFWMLGVYAVGGDDHTDELGSSYSARILKKYGNSDNAWAQANRRLLSWGFNTLGPYCYRMVWPTAESTLWPRQQQPVKLPVVHIGYHPASNCLNDGSCKNLYRGLDPAVLSIGRNFPDVFDPKYATFLPGWYSSDWAMQQLRRSPYLIGAFSDDTDDVYGFGPGVDFPTDPPGKDSPHLGLITLITAPTQTANPYSSPANLPYADAAVHAKSELRNWLARKYGNIQALNQAWGSNYTSFDSDGGWPAGRGLMDENGRASHAWLGARLDSSGLTGMATNIRADLDGFLYELAARYFQANGDAIEAAAPGILYFGPTNLGGWRSPARGPILKAAGEYLDVISTGGTDGSQAQLDFTTRWAGDVPLVIWEGMVANPDSGRWRYKPESASWTLPTQDARGRKFRDDVQALLNGFAGPTGSKPYVGFTYWAWLDTFSEQMNFGLVSMLDNAYDGKEARRAGSLDDWGYVVGGEERDYGDFLSYVRLMNQEVFDTIQSEALSYAIPGGRRSQPRPMRPRPVSSGIGQ